MNGSCENEGRQIRLGDARENAAVSRVTKSQRRRPWILSIHPGYARARQLAWRVSGTRRDGFRLPGGGGGHRSLCDERTVYTVNTSSPFCFAFSVWLDGTTPSFSDAAQRHEFWLDRVALCGNDVAQRHGPRAQPCIHGCLTSCARCDSNSIAET